jgi:hypothetical protein
MKESVFEIEWLKRKIDNLRKCKAKVHGVASKARETTLHMF